MANERVSIPLAGGEAMSGYLARPPSGRGPGIVLLQEIFGVNEAIRTAADDLAAEGFTVLAPDMFWRLEPGVELGYSDEDRQKAFGYWQRFDNSQGAKDARAAMDFLKGHDSCTGKAAFLGFCLGGKLAVMAAARGGADAAVSFYGVKLQENHDELTSLPCPLQLHVGDADSHVPMEVVRDIEALTADLDVETFVYPGAGHGFYNKVRTDVFDKAAWTKATERVLGFLNRTLA